MSIDYYQQSFTDLKIYKRDKTLWIYLDRERFSNAYSEGMISSLIEVMNKADKDREIRVIILTGQGKHFCAGGDLKAMRDRSGMFAGDSEELRERYQNGIQQIPRTFSQLKTPVIAMINGAAIGAGLDLAAMCDLRIASDKAVLGETFAQVGLVPGDGGAYFLTRIIGFSKAMELFLTCEKISATKAHDIGLVHQVISHDQLEVRVSEIANRLCEFPPLALQMTKKAVIHAYENDLSSHLELMASFQSITQRTQDHDDAVQKILDQNKKK